MSDGRVHTTSIKFTPSARSLRRFRLCLGSLYVNDLNLFGRAYLVLDSTEWFNIVECEESRDIQQSAITSIPNIPEGSYDLIPRL
jgi:hypothetical protein